MTRRRGFTLIELMLALILASVLGTIVTKSLVSTSHFYARDSGQRAARVVARSATSLIESELRMAEASGGLVSGDSTTITVRVPYALGMLCTSGVTPAQVSLLPMDSIAYATAGFSGFAARDAAGAYSYFETSPALSAGNAASCTTASITTLTGGAVVQVTPMPAASFVVGAPVLLYQRITYRFAASTILPGRRGLYRDVVATGVSEELAAPFDATARFRFYALNADTAQSLIPSPASNTRGIELVLNGSSEKTAFGAAQPETAMFTTAVFFRNRSN